jgi:hypothetical protein
MKTTGTSVEVANKSTDEIARFLAGDAAPPKKHD